MPSADLVLTGEGRLDATSLAGKAPVGVVRLCLPADAGRAHRRRSRRRSRPGARVTSLTQRIGRDRALADPLPEIRAATAELLAPPTGAALSAGPCRIASVSQ